MAKPKVEERLRLIEDILDELRERDPGTAILVEGDRDVTSLTALGVPGPILKINVGSSMLNLCETLAKEHPAFVVLMDWDRKGKQLAARLETLLASTGVQVDMTFWRRLGRVLPYQIHEVESLDSHVERLRAEVGQR